MAGVTNQWTTGLIRLRAVEPSDWEAFHGFDQDTEGQRNGWRIQFPRSEEGTRAWATELANRRADGDSIYLAIESPDGVVVGSINVHDADRRNSTFEYGIHIGAEHRGKGYAREAIRLILHHYFRELGYQKANATVYAFNEPSIALHRKFGFVEEGRIRRNHFSEGVYHDELWFGMTSEEFAERHGGS
jgi:RimJ/RimL family protein N-acetyltransferase